MRSQYTQSKTISTHDYTHYIADCCSGCSSVRSSTFATFKSSSKMVSEDTALVHIDGYRYGPMERPLILRVIDEPGTALKGEIVVLPVAVITLAIYSQGSQFQFPFLVQVQMVQ